MNSDQKPITRSSGGGKGGKGAFAPGSTVYGAAFGGAKIWNSEIWPLLANWQFSFWQLQLIT